MGPIEKEDFDPTEFSAEFVAVGQDEAISTILERVGEALGRTPNVVLIIPRGSQAFHSTQDFLALGKLQWSGEARVAVASPDPTIAGLARVLGFHIVDAPADHPSIAGDPSFDQSGAADDGIEQPTAPLPLGTMPEWVLSPSVPIVMPSSSSLTTSTWLNMPGDALAPPQTRQPAQRSGMPPPRTRPRQTGMLLPTNIGSAPPLTPVIDPSKVDDPKTEDGDAKARRAVIDSKAYRNGLRWRYNTVGRNMRWGRILAAISVLLVVALIAGSAYAYVYLPEGTISVKPLQKSIGLPVEVTVFTGPSSSVRQSGTPANNQGDSPPSLSGGSITGITLEAPLSEEGTAPATGTRQVPTGKAHGTMHFANQTSLTKFVPAGTQFNAPNGIIIQTTQDVSVKPTDLLASTIGKADAPIVANVLGPDGNLAAGQLTGLYGNALQYTNSALTGGTLETVKVVTQADIDALTATLTAKIEEEVPGAVALKVQPGQQLITQTIGLMDRQIVADHKDGEDGETVKVKVSGIARGYAYPEDKMDDSISQAVYDWVKTPANISGDAGPTVDRGNITYDPPVILSVDNETGHVTYGTNASFLVKFTLTPAMQRQISDLVKGQDIAKARQLIEQTYGGYLNAQSIQAKVLWFNVGKLPSDPAHIVVQLGSGGSYPPGTGNVSPPSQTTDNSARPSQR
jgi:hypothetical protein